MWDYSHQKEEIATIKERHIALNLSDADTQRIAERAESVGLTVSELLENFIGDLVGGTYSNGSDERMYADEWFNRCGFSFEPEETFTKYLIELGAVEDTVKTLRIIEDWEADLEAPDIPEEEKKEIQEDIDYNRNEVAETYNDYKETTVKPQSYEEAIKGVKAYWDRLEALRGE